MKAAELHTILDGSEDHNLPRILGDYKLIKLLGKGGMGNVYKGESLKTDQIVAVKLLTSSSKFSYSKEYVQQFRHEAEFLSQAKHPNIVQFIDFGTSENKELYLVMEYIEGITLSAFIKNHKLLDIKTFLDLAIQMADAVQCLQDYGLVHRDIKPQNIMLTPHLGIDIVKILDFGLSTLAADIKEKDDEAGNVIGTVLYSAPEQTGMIERKVDIRSDLYSLGIVFYEMLAGKNPFNSSFPEKISYQHLSVIPPLIHDIRPEISSVISMIIQKLLNKDPEERYQTAYGLLYDLKECQKKLIQLGEIKAFTIALHDHLQGFNFLSKMVGREKCMNSLTKSLGLAKSGTPHAVILTGELGIGKSYLVSEFRIQNINDKIAYLCCRLQRMAFDCGLQPIYQMIDSYFAHLLRASDTKRKRILANISAIAVENVIQLLKFVPNSKEIFSHIIHIDPSAIDNISKKIEEKNSLHKYIEKDIVDALIDVFIEISKSEECLIVEVDNAQWADVEIFNFLKKLLIKASPVNGNLLCIISTSVDKGIVHDELHNFIQSLRISAIYVQQLNLHPFTLEEEAVLISNILDDTVEKKELITQKLHSFTKGNPLFLREVLKSMTAEGVLIFDKNTGKWLCTNDDLSKLRLPVDVIELLIERTHSLSLDCRLILGAAARVGFNFSEELLCKIYPEKVNIIRETLKTSLSEHFITELDGKYSFSHSKIRDYFISSISEDNSTDIHIRMIDYLRDLQKDTNLPNLREYAYHAYFARSRMSEELVCMACCQLAIIEEMACDIQQANEQINRALEIASGARNSQLIKAIPLLKAKSAEILRKIGQPLRAIEVLKDVLNLANTFSHNENLIILLITYEILLRIKILCGDNQIFTKDEDELINLAFSFIRKEIDSSTHENDKLNLLQIAKSILSINKLAKRGVFDELCNTVNTENDFIELQKNLGPEFYLRKIIEIPNGLLDLLVPAKDRLKSSLHFILALYFLSKDNNAKNDIINLWEYNKEVFLECHTDFLWKIWLRDFSEYKAKTEIQEIIEEVFELICFEDLPGKFSANVFFMCLNLYATWEEQSVEEIQLNLDQLANLGEICRQKGLYYPCIWSLLTVSSFKFLFGDWNDIFKNIENAIAEAEHLGYKSTIDECNAYFAVFNVLRNKTRFERMEEYYKTSTPNMIVENLLMTGKILNEFSEHPLSTEIELSSINTYQSQWQINNPLSKLAIFLALQAQIANLAENRTKAHLYLALPITEIEKYIHDLFPRASKPGFSRLFLSSLEYCLELVHGRGNKWKQQFMSAELEAQKHSLILWQLCSRLLIHRIKNAEAQQRSSQLIADEAAIHLVVALRLAEEVGFQRLGSSIQLDAATLFSAQDISGMSRNVTIGRNASSFLGKLKIEKVLTYANLLLNKEKIEDLITTALDSLIELTGAERGVVFVRDQTSTTFVLKSLFGFKDMENIVDNFRIEALSDIEPELPISWAIISKVRMEGRLIVVHNAQTDDSIANQFSIVKNKILSVLGIPLTHKDELIGIIYLDSCIIKDLFTREILKSITPLAKQIAFSIANIWLQRSSEEAYYALKQSQKSLIQSEKMAGIGTLAASLSHDLKTPLSTILGISEELAELLKDKQNNEVTACITGINNAAGKMQRLVLAMQNFSRKSNKELAPVSLRKVLEEVLFLTGKKVSRYGIDMSISVPADTPMIYGNANELEQIFMNLVNNATDAMETTPLKKLTIDAQFVNDSQIVVSVTDTGIGIPAELQKQIFQPFYTTKALDKGTGLGLSIVKTLIQEQFGSIEVESKVGVGTKFIITLPTIDRAGNIKGQTKRNASP